MVLTSARVGRRKVSRSVATTLGLASRKVTLEKSCNMSGSVEVTKVKVSTQTKGEAGFPPPLEPSISFDLKDSAGSVWDPADSKFDPPSIQPPLRAGAPR